MAVIRFVTGVKRFDVASYIAMLLVTPLIVMVYHGVVFKN